MTGRMTTWRSRAHDLHWHHGQPILFAELPAQFLGESFRCRRILRNRKRGRAAAGHERSECAVRAKEILEKLEQWIFLERRCFERIVKQPAGFGEIGGGGNQRGGPMLAPPPAGGPNTGGEREVRVRPAGREA